jgi:hypothetical protein
MILSSSTLHSKSKEFIRRINRPVYLERATAASNAGLYRAACIACCRI